MCFPYIPANMNDIGLKSGITVAGNETLAQVVPLKD